SKRRGLGENAKKVARCPFHKPDKHPSFSVFQRGDGTWWHKCFAGCSEGDEIAFLVKHFNITRGEAIKRYLDMAGFPTCPPRESREYPESRKSLESPKFPESPCVSISPVCLVSEGQSRNGELEKELEDLARRNACTRAGDRAERKRFKLARRVSGFLVKLGQKFYPPELKQVLSEWYRLSQPFLNPAEARNDHFIMFLAELAKVREPAREDHKLEKALENVSKLSLDQLPTIPSVPEKFREKYRRLAALHREMSRLCEGKIYFLSYCDVAKVCDGLSHQEAHAITYGLVPLGVIEIVRKGKAGLNSRKASGFRYLLPETENGTQEDDGGFELYVVFEIFGTILPVRAEGRGRPAH